MHEWSAEVSVDRDLAHRLIARQFPGLDLTELRLLSEGWDNTVWLVDRRWVFRFPRREVVIPGIEREMTLLPRLAPLLPLPIPRPVFFGRPADGFQWPFFGAALIPGRETADCACRDADRCRLARPLAAFLRALHDSATAAAVDPAGELPRDPMGRGDMELRVPRTAARLVEVERLGMWRAPESVHDVLDAAEGLGAAESSALVHGDLHIRHLLVDDRCGAAGVIDWIDICRGDPAIDLPLFWSLLPAAARPAFLDEYGTVTDAQLLRARVLALFLSARLPSTLTTRESATWSARPSPRSRGRRSTESLPSRVPPQGPDYRFDFHRHRGAGHRNRDISITPAPQSVRVLCAERIAP